MKNFVKRFLRVFVFIMAVFMAVTCLQLNCIFGDAAEKKKAVCKFGTPNIDGEEDTVWKNTDSYDINKTKVSTGTAVDDPSSDNLSTGIFKLLYDDTNLYILFIIKDSTIYINETLAFNVQDAVEVQLNPYNTADTTYTENQMKFAVTRGAMIGSGQIQTQDKLKIIGGTGVAKGKQDKNLLNFAVKEKDDSYIVEIALNMKQLFPDFKFEDGYVFGLDAQIDDVANNAATDVKRNLCLGWNDGANLAYINPQTLGQVTLSGEKVKSEDETAAPVSTTPPATSAPRVTNAIQPTPESLSPGLIIGIAAGVVIIAGVVIAVVILSKKRK